MVNANRIVEHVSKFAGIVHDHSYGVGLLILTVRLSVLFSASHQHFAFSYSCSNGVQIGNFCSKLHSLLRTILKAVYKFQSQCRYMIMMESVVKVAVLNSPQSPSSPPSHTHTHPIDTDNCIRVPVVLQKTKI